MKKLILIVFLIFLLCGCKKDNKELKKYEEYVRVLKDAVVYDEDIPFDMEIYIDKVTGEEVMYRLIIDNPKEALEDIDAIIVHDKDTSDIFPSIGIFDDKVNLIPELIDGSKNVKGIVLVGYIPYDKDTNGLNINFKVLLNYKDSDNNLHRIIYSTKKSI